MSTMTSAQFVFYLTCLFLGEMAKATDQKFSSSFRQDRRFVSANVGDNLTLPCFCGNDDTTRLYWYKQSLGQRPKLISTKYVFNSFGTFHDEFTNNSRFTLDTEIDKNHLTITDLRISDSAAYYCVERYSFTIEFSESTTVSVKGLGLNIQSWVHQSASETIQPGGSVTLNCTVHTGTCDEENSVYWFKNSGESQPKIIYTHGGRNDQCEKETHKQTHTCVYNLPMMSPNLSDAGTYYCAVASCGHILFGNGTKLNFKDEADSLVYFLSGALAFTTILSVLLSFLMCVINKGDSCKCAGSVARSSAPSTMMTEALQHEENIHYAALREHRVNSSRRQRNNTKTECVYSSVKQ